MRSTIPVGRPFVNWVNGAHSAKGKAARKPANALPTVQKDGALRPHLDIKVNPNHGLYGFFRRTEEGGEVKYDTLESMNSTAAKSGTSHSVACKTWTSLTTIALLAAAHRAVRPFMDGCRASSEKLHGLAHSVVCLASGAQSPRHAVPRGPPYWHQSVRPGIVYPPRVQGLHIHTLPPVVV